MNNFEIFVDKYLDNLKPCVLSEAMAYSLKGGKRFRPRVIFSLLKGMNIDEEQGYACALGLELIQTYSLIHDDLPAMDNDDYRRGKPSLHKAYREDIAILAGDQLLTDAFRVICESDYTNECKVNMVVSLSKYAGMDGMIYGQLLDVTADSKELSKQHLFEIQDNKTSGLFKVACLFAMHMNNENNYDYYLGLGSKIGEIFQNQDDLFDMLRSKEELGKSNSDLENDKATALSIYSINELKELIENEFIELDKYLEKASFDTKYLKELLVSLKNR